MTVARVAVIDPLVNQPRPIGIGDTMGAAEVINKDNVTVGASTLTVQSLLQGLLKRGGTQVGGFNDTTPSASQIVAAILGNRDYVDNSLNSPVSIPSGLTFRFRYLNTTGQTATLVAGTGVTITGTATIATVTGREYLVTIVNGSTPGLYSGNTISGDNTVRGFSQQTTNKITPGMSVTGTGIPANTTVIGILPGVGVILSADATATNTAVALTFGPAVTFENIGTVGTVS